ncbi:unnamed protein product [Nesidiocoris tenuis]|uniref:V-type proton ATPase subunit C n=2 Tax=Nesidiocoris tenuis TaxID=355587 RepID=A0A6H5H3Q7_9HEMI|nr:subunit C [Nesidiocoris tenuis]CAB0011250.1 unnamed protein product [Nesidiocoris tenuis]CAB0011253.1 unnamed protein product [Nesidiocoris tenuis]
MSEYWLISVPSEGSTQKTWETLHNMTTYQNNLSENYKFHIPDLKVGTLDQLVGLSDDLGKIDAFVEQVTHKVAQYFGEVLDCQKDKLHENLLANNMELPSYLTRFSWDMAKYPIKQSLRNIADIISKQVSQIDAELKSKSNAYNSLKNTLQSMEKKQSGSLLTRNLGDLVRKELFILDSEYLVTLLVVVPKIMVTDWNNKYERLAAMVVPRSSQLVFSDDDYALFTVTLFRKGVDDFKTKARENKFVVRDFVYNEEEMAAGKNEISKLVTDRKKQFGPLVRWLKVNFSECFCAWIHVKALRVFVESVLRYGLPVNFVAMLLHPHKKSVKRLRDVLNQLYGHLDSSAQGGGGGGSGNFSSANDAVDMVGLGFGQSDYFAYVYYKINIDMLEAKA